MKKYKRLFAASTAFAITASFLLVGFIVTDEPETVLLGTGRAGVADTAVADTAAAVAGDSAGAARPTTGTEPEANEVAEQLPEGEASYYGSELAGRPTASGQRFDPEKMTAAHRTLPFGTRLRVTNVRSGRSVVVTVNDRGPFSGRRVLDLSRSAARQIGMLQRGVARVRMEVLK